MNPCLDIFHCGSQRWSFLWILQSPDGFWGIKAKYGGETPIIVAVLLQHHYLHIQSSSGQKGIHQRTVPDSLFSDQAFLNHSSTVLFGVTLARKMYVVWKLLQCTLMQLYLLCFITFYFQFGIYKWIRTQHTTLMKRKRLNGPSTSASVSRSNNSPKQSGIQREM